VLILPGLGGSEPGHWQRLLLEREPRAEWVEQDDWDRPDPAAWTARLAATAADQPCLLVAHSLGCALVAHLAAGAPARVDGALLVSPADVDDPGRTPPETRPFAPIPRERLPFPAIVAASSNDPYVSQETARGLAAAWGARFVDAGPAGHINVDSGHGAWPLGEQLLAELRA
jgi:predicted alpha/beta hydrolase family esterase